MWKMEIKGLTSMVAVTHGKGGVYVIAPSTSVPAPVAVCSLEGRGAKAHSGP